MIKKAIKEMLLFSIAVNAVGGILMLLANFALPIFVSGSAESIVAFGWPCVAVVAYIVFDRKLDINVKEGFLESVFIYWINLMIWVGFTQLFLKLTMWVAESGPWFTEEREDAWYRSQAQFLGGSYDWMYGLMAVVMMFVFFVCFVVRTIYCLRKR